jgi:hypothetical protein
MLTYAAESKDEIPQAHIYLHQVSLSLARSLSLPVCVCVCVCVCVRACACACAYNNIYSGTVQRNAQNNQKINVLNEFNVFTAHAQFQPLHLPTAHLFFFNKKKQRSVMRKRGQGVNAFTAHNYNRYSSQLLTFNTRDPDSRAK